MLRPNTMLNFLHAVFFNKECDISTTSFFTGAHTNHIESTWSSTKRFLRGKKCDSTYNLNRWLTVFMWRQWHKDSNLFFNLLDEIRHV